MEMHTLFHLKSHSMPKMKDEPGAFTGTIGNLVYYRRPDIEGILVRRKGGVSKKKIRDLPQFERTRENNTEFSGCARAASVMGDAIRMVSHMADFNITPALVSIMKKVQVTSTEEDRGERSIFISRQKHLLENFQCNRKFPFTGLVRHPLQTAVDRSGTAQITIPALIPGINLFLPWKAPYYRFIFSLATLPDQVYDKSNFRTTPDVHDDVYDDGPWQLAAQPSAIQTVTLQVNPLTDPAHTLVLAACLEMGTPGIDGLPHPVPRQGAAIILRLV